tara:strand:- start:1991 stop:3229 length:1239 start_codon:yes stop_codon:yes gene_type:complete
MFLQNYHYLKNKEVLASIFLFLLSFILRIPIIFMYGDQGLDHEWKFLVYNLVEHGQLVYQTFDNGFLLPNLWMPPLYAYYLYLFTFLNLENQNFILIVLISQILLASISIIVFYKINKFFFSKKVSFLSSLIFSLFPLHLYACSQISSISLQVFLTIVFFYLFIKVTQKANFYNFSFFAFIAGLLILLRGEFWAIFVVSVIYLYLFLKIKFKNIILIVLITSITVSPYILRNYIIFNKFTVLKSFGYNLWKGNHPYAKNHSIVEGTEITNENLLKEINEIKINKFYRINFDDLFLKHAINNIKSDPIGHTIFVMKKALSFIFISFSSSDEKYWNPLHYLPLFIFGCTSVIGIFLSNKKSHLFNFLILMFLVNIAIFSAVSILPRYKLIILPLQIIFTSVLFERIKGKFFNRS